MKTMSLIAANDWQWKQAIKTAIAGVASLYAAKLCRLPEEYWAPISALIVMQSSVGATVSASWSRLAGTAVGALVGGAFVAMWGVNVLAFGVAVAIAFVVCSVLRLQESQRLATVTVAILMLIGRLNSPWMIALDRFLEVSIGIVVALLVSIVLWPARARASLLKGISEALASLEALYQAVSRRYRGGARAPVDKLKLSIGETLARNTNLMQHALYERVGTARDYERMALLLDRVSRIYQAIAALELATVDSAGDTYYRNFELELKRLEIELSLQFEWLAESIPAWRFDREWPELASAVSELEEKAAASRKSGASRTHELEEILRFYTFLLSSKNLVRELDLTHSLLTASQ
jgi:uncharacterized membrane protein YgaE (UPF0421/DUF939 family)